MHSVIALAAGLFTTLAAGCSRRRNGTVATLDDTGSVVQVEWGEVLTVELEADAAAGYTWTIADIDFAALAPTGEPVFASGPGLAGAAGVVRHTLLARRSGRTEVEFWYRRTWEDEPPLRTARLWVEVL